MTTALAVTGSTPATAASTAPSIGRTSKTAVAKAYVDQVAKNLAVSPGWTGSVKGCKVAKNSAKHDKASLAVVNWARAQSGLSPVRWDATWARQARAHALMTSATNRLAHDVLPVASASPRTRRSAARRRTSRSGPTDRCP